MPCIQHLPSTVYTSVLPNRVADLHNMAPRRTGVHAYIQAKILDHPTGNFTLLRLQNPIEVDCDDHRDIQYALGSSRLRFMASEELHAQYPREDLNLYKVIPDVLTCRLTLIHVLSKCEDVDLVTLEAGGGDPVLALKLFVAALVDEAGLEVAGQWFRSCFADVIDAMVLLFIEFTTKQTDAIASDVAVRAGKRALKYTPPTPPRPSKRARTGTFVPAPIFDFEGARSRTGLSVVPTDGEDLALPTRVAPLRPRTSIPSRSGRKRAANSRINGRKSTTRTRRPSAATTPFSTVDFDFDPHGANSSDLLDKPAALQDARQGGIQNVLPRIIEVHDVDEETSYAGYVYAF